MVEIGYPRQLLLNINHRRVHLSKFIFLRAQGSWLLLSLDVKTTSHLKRFYKGVAITISNGHFMFSQNYDIFQGTKRFPEILQGFC